MNCYVVHCRLTSVYLLQVMFYKLVETAHLFKFSVGQGVTNVQPSPGVNDVIVLWQ
jgi:hypothetical protein